MCDVWGQRLRSESRDLAHAVIGELGEIDPVSHARLVTARAMGAIGAAGSGSEQVREMQLALELARAGGDRRVELLTFSALAVARAEAGDDDPAAWHQVQVMAEQLGDWERATSAVTNAGLSLLDDHAADVYDKADQARDIAVAHGRRERMPVGPTISRARRRLYPAIGTSQLRSAAELSRSGSRMPIAG